MNHTTTPPPHRISAGLKPDYVITDGTQWLKFATQMPRPLDMDILIMRADSGRIEPYKNGRYMYDENDLWTPYVAQPEAPTAHPNLPTTECLQGQPGDTCQHVFCQPVPTVQPELKPDDEQREYSCFDLVTPRPATARPEQAKSGYAWEQWSDQVAPKISLEGAVAQPAPTAAGTQARIIQLMDDARQHPAYAEQGREMAAETPRTDEAPKFQVKMCPSLGRPDFIPYVSADFARTLERELAAAQAEVAQGLREAVRLAEIVWKAHYRDAAPNWKPFDYVAGVVSQLDNMYAGLRDELVQSTQAHADTLAKLEEVTKDRDYIASHWALKCEGLEKSANDMASWVACKMLEPEWDSFKKSLEVIEYWKDQWNKQTAERDDLRAKLTAAEQEIAYDNAVVDDLKTRLETAEQSAEHWQTEWRKQEEAHRLAAQQVADLQRWKDEALTVESWWSKIDKYMRVSGKARLGYNVSDEVLRILQS